MLWHKSHQAQGEDLKIKLYICDADERYQHCTKHVFDFCDEKWVNGLHCGKNLGKGSSTVRIKFGIKMWMEWSEASIFTKAYCDCEAVLTNWLVWAEGQEEKEEAKREVEAGLAENQIVAHEVLLVVPSIEINIDCDWFYKIGTTTLTIKQ